MTLEKLGDLISMIKLLRRSSREHIQNQIIGAGGGYLAAALVLCNRGETRRKLAAPIPLTDPFWRNIAFLDIVPKPRKIYVS